MSQSTIAVGERLDHEGGLDLLKQVREALKSGKTEIHLDFSESTAIDSQGGACLIEISDAVRRKKGELVIDKADGFVAEFLDILRPALASRPEKVVSEPNLFEAVGGAAISGWAELKQFKELSVDAIYWTLIAPFEGRGFRWNLFIDEVYEMGVRAIAIVATMNFLLGLIIAMLSAKQVESFGLTLYVADLIVIGFARELAAIMTAVVVSARSGAAIAAEIATMKVQEELDAIRGMGLNVNQFLVAPKILAMVVVLPCLVALGLVTGVLGGALWGVFVLDFQPIIWFDQTVNATSFDDLLQGFLKTFFFAIAIVMIGCHNGFRVSGGSRGVGLMTTRAVVMDIFLIIVIDIFFAIIFYYVLK